MTYVDIVNNVLRRIREEEVTSVQDNTYSKMVGDFVNDAKKLVEDAWDWSGLRTTLTVTTEAGIFNYALVGSQNKIKVLDALNDTSNFFLEYKGSSWFNDKYLNSSTAATGTPKNYSFNGIDANGDTLVDIYPKPNDVYELRFNVVLRNPDLSADTDVLTIPAQPVIHMAVALLARERGETGGTSTPEYFAIADKYLSDAIALDAARHPEETVWYS
jgi:hypothetical protein